MKADKLMYLYLLLQPLIDLMTAYMTRHFTIPLTIGVLARGLFLLVMVIYCLFYTDDKCRKSTLKYGVLLLAFGILYFMTKPDLWTIQYLINEIIYLFKYFYFPVVLMLLYEAYPHLNLERDKLMGVFAVNALSIAFFIIVPYLTGTGFESYVGRADKTGTVGWFYAANEIGAILTLVFPCVYLFLQHKRFSLFFVSSIAVGFSMMLLGTKVALLALLGIEFLWLIYFFVNRKKKAGILWCTVLLIVSIGIIPVLPATSNVNSSIDKYTKPAEETVDESQTPSQSSTKNPILDKAIKVIFSGRQKFLQNTMNIYTDSELDDQMFGLGFTNRPSINNKKVEKLIELDPFDVFFHYGIVGSIVYFMPIIWILFSCLKKLVRQNIFGNFYVYGCCVAILLAFGISCTAGHVFGAPGVSTYLIFFMVMLLRELSAPGKKKLRNEVTILALHVNYGGAEKYLSSLCKMLEGRYPVHLIVTYKISEKPAFEFGSHVKITYLIDGGPNREAFKSAIRQKSISQVIREGMKSVRILFLREWRNIQAARQIKSRYVITTRPLHSRIAGIYCPEETVKIATEHNYLINDKKYVKKMQNSLAYFQYLVCVSENLQRFYAGKLKNIQCVFIPNVIDHLPKKQAALNDHVLINVGRLEPEKGHLDLIDVISHVKETMPNIKLYVIGDGSLKEKIENKIESLNLTDNIELTGFLSKDDMEKYILDSGLFVMTSLSESFGLVLIEAMSYALPCIGFDSADGTKELLKNGTGVLVPNRDIEKMSSEIAEILSNPDRQRELAQRGYQYCQRYLIENVKLQWLELLRKSA